MASPNPFTPLGEDEISNPREDADAAAPPPGYTDPRAPTHGWDSFVHSLDETAQRELGVVDDILISYANFAGEEFRMFDIESARVMDQIIAMEDALEFDHDEGKYLECGGTAGYGGRHICTGDDHGGSSQRCY